MEILNHDFYRRCSPDILVVDDFFTDPDFVREIGLGMDYRENLADYKGRRSAGRQLWPGLREEFSRLLQRPVTVWQEYGYNGCFQITTPQDPLVYHSDVQGYAGAVYLTPGAVDGTDFWQHRTGRRRCAGEDFEDSAAWELLDQVAGLYNRLVLWDASLIHSAHAYTTDRLVQLFFFDVL